MPAAITAKSRSKTGSSTGKPQFKAHRSSSIQRIAPRDFFIDPGENPDISDEVNWNYW
jgi:hypothetical protein